MEKKNYIAPEADIEQLNAEDIVLISLGDSGNLPTIPWEGSNSAKSDW